MTLTDQTVPPTVVRTALGDPDGGTKKHILTIALEDYFHGPTFSKSLRPSRWAQFESRCEKNTETVLEILKRKNSHATFFVNPWVAETLPSILRSVVTHGHEIALAGQRGRSFRHLTADALREQIRRDRGVLEAACGKQVVGFRVTDVFLTPKDLWALELLADEGFRYDSSVSPFLRCFSGEPDRQYIYRAAFAAGDFWEVPLTSLDFAGLLVPAAGGNYFRQVPEWVVKRALTLSDRRSAKSPMVLYFRLWDFDPLHPRLQTGSMLRDLRHYRNGDRMLRTLDHVLTSYRFDSVAGYLNLNLGNRDLRELQTGGTTDLAFSTNRTKVSIIVPCFNEAPSIPYLASNLLALELELRPKYEVDFILVDDGSTDGTWEVLEHTFATRGDIRLRRHARNRGISAAILTGLQEAHEIACSMDCDCSYNPKDLKSMLLLLADGVDLVTASPYHPDGSVHNVPRWRLMISRYCSALYRRATQSQLHTFTSCMRVYRRSSVMKIVPHHHSFLGVAELMGRCLVEGRVVIEYPTTLEARVFGQSKMKIIRTAMGHVGLLWALAASRRNRKPALRARYEVNRVTQPEPSTVTLRPKSSYADARRPWVMRVFRRLLCFAGLAVLMHAQSGAISSAGNRELYRLGPDDQIGIRVMDLEKLQLDNAAAPKVDLDGNLNLPLIGQVHAAGLTVAELNARICDRLSGILQHPQASVSVIQYRNHPISVLGAVRTPGTIQVPNTRRLQEVLSLAGGLSTDAGPVITVTRPKGHLSEVPVGWTVSADSNSYVTRIGVQALLSAREPHLNIDLQENDVVTVPRAELIYVLGAVKKAGGFTIGERSQISVLQAIALAEGLDINASERSVRLLRSAGPGSERKESNLNLKPIMAGTATDVELRANDILFIPTSATKRMTTRGIEAAISLGTGALIWR